MRKYVQPYGISICWWIAVVALAVVSLIGSTKAHAVTAGSLSNPVTGQISGTSVLLDYAANGNYSRQFAPAAAATIASDGASTLALSRSVYVPNPSGVLVPVTVSGRVPASAVASLIKKAVPLVPYLGTGVAVYELAKELGFTLTKTGDVVGVVKASGVTVATSIGTLCQGNSPFSSVGQSYYITQYNQTLTVITGAGPMPTGASLVNNCTGSAGSWQYAAMVNGTYPRLVVFSGNTLTSAASTLDDLANSIASSSGWPSTSNVSQAVVDAQNITNSSVSTSTPTVSGPATSTGSTTTTTNPDGTKLVSTTTYGHTYNTNTQVTNATTTNQTYNTSNVVTSTTTTTSTAPPALEQKTDCEKYPDNLGCSKFGDAVSQTLKTADSGFSSISPVTFASSASCPSPLSFSVRGASYSLKYDGMCTAANDYVKPVVLVLGAALAMFVFVGGFKL